MHHVTVKTCTPQDTNMVNVTRYSTDNLKSSDEFDIADAVELRTRLAPYEDKEGVIVFIDGQDYGPAYAATDNFENGEWFPL